MCIRFFVFTISLLFWLVAPSFASDTFRPLPRLSGFGTFGYSWDDNERMAAIRDITQRPEHFFQTDKYWKLDSRIGMHIDYRITPRWEVVGQLVWRDQIADGLKDSIELANIAFFPTANLDLRLGRVGLDGFMMSDHRNLGYAYDWVRPPQGFYGMIPYFFVDGINVSYTLPVERGYWGIKAQTGQSHFTLPFGRNDYLLKANIDIAFSITRDLRPWKIKGGFMLLTFESDVPAFFPIYDGLDQIAAAAIRGVSTEAAEVRKDLTFKNGRAVNANLGVSYDNGLWTGQAELGYSSSDRSLVTPKNIRGYVKLGRRMDKFTPFVMLSSAHQLNDTREPKHDWGDYSGLRDQAFNIANASRVEQNTLALGVRWDFHDQMALKLQWDHTQVKPEGYASWFRSIPLNTQESQVNLWSINLDFVF